MSQVLQPQQPEKHEQGSAVLLDTHNTRKMHEQERTPREKNLWGGKRGDRRWEVRAVCAEHECMKSLKMTNNNKTKIVPV